METTLREIRKISPPRISPEHVRKHVHAYVSMHGDLPVMRADEEANAKCKKIVAHNYGHGGCGWSLAPGAASHVGGLLAGKTAAVGYGAAEPICVIGAGVIGLFTARDLLLRGYTNITVRAADFDELTSHKAGATARWAPLGFRTASEESRQTLLHVCRASRDFYNSLSIDPDNPLQSAVRRMPFYADSVIPDPDGLRESPKAVTLDFGNGVQREMFAYDDTVFIETVVFMRRLRDDLHSNGVKFEQATVLAISDVPETIVVNCAGVGGRGLAKDTESKTIFLHLTHLSGQVASPRDLEYTLFTKAKEGALSYFPKNLLSSGDESALQSGHFGAIGGSFVVVESEADLCADEFARVLRDAQWFFHGQ